jgi:hypothetical protein
VLNVGKFALCVLFLAALAVACYRNPVPDDFDRYFYEAIVLGESQPLEVVYSIVKHENARTESSSTLDSPQHLREMEPMRAIRPVYIAAISLLSRALPIQKAISLISAISLFGIGIVVLCWTRQPLLAGLLMAATPIPLLGRFGAPDALASLLVISALWMLQQRKGLALGILFMSLGVRTDNILILFAVLAWLVWEKRLPRIAAAALAGLATVIVFGINHWAGNYGWIVLFRLTFLGGRYPAEIPHVLTIREYLGVLAHGTYAILDHVALWLLLGVLAWRRRRDPLLIVAACAAAAHFVLFPSGEDRYLVWAYIVAGVALIRSFEPREPLNAS